MTIIKQFYNKHFEGHITRTYTLTNEVTTTPLMMECLEHFFLNINDEINISNIYVTRGTPSKNGCRYEIQFSYTHPVSKKFITTTRKYTIHPITKELSFK